MHLKIIFLENFLTSAGNFGPYGPPILDHYFWKNGNFHKNCHIFCIGLNQTKNLFFSESRSKCTKMLENFFGMVLGPKWHFMEAESIYIPHTKKMPMLFLHTVKNSFYKGVLLVRVFQTKKKVIFRTKFWTFIFFSLFMGSQPYL